MRCLGLELLGVMASMDLLKPHIVGERNSTEHDAVHGIRSLCATGPLKSRQRRSNPLTTFGRRGRTGDRIESAAGTGLREDPLAEDSIEEQTASDWFQKGVELEATDKSEAERAYRRAIGESPAFVDPYLNLGVILCDVGRCEEAVELYRQALEQNPDEPLLHFNMAIALEDGQHIDEALTAYERCMKLSPEFADAHYNAARLHERLGHKTRAIRHYSEYRRLQR